MKKRSLILPIRLSDTLRTVVAYFALIFSIFGLILSCVTATYSYLQHLFIDDINRLVRGYHASDVLLTISTLGTISGTVYVIGCYICFRVTGPRDRSGCIGYVLGYMLTLLIMVIGLSYALYECYAGLQKPAADRSLEVCSFLPRDAL